MVLALLNNRYHIIRALGGGGFGDTFLAEDTHLPSRRICVIKQLKPVTHKPQVYQLIQERFGREAAILEELGEGHEQIPRLYAYFVENEHFYLVQEWVEGLTLSQKVQEEGLFSERLVGELLVNLLPVLDYIHTKGIIHRDIKPGNIIWRKQDGKPVLIDFGVAKEIMTTVVDERGEITSSIVVGTPGFMPPEQAAGKPVYSSDLYSLGLTGIYLLTGKRPQDWKTNLETGEISWRAEVNINNNLANVLDRAIQSHPRDRYPNAKTMLADLYHQDMGTRDWRLGSRDRERLNYNFHSPITHRQENILTEKTLRTKIPENDQEYRNRQILLNKVKNYWVKGVLETSLHGVALIELGLENRFDALDRPWGILWETPAQARQSLPENTRIIDLFQQMGAGRSLLILGEPGSGKTTTLLELARDLLQEAELDINQPIPVVFNLSAWVNENITIADWLVRELNTKYQVSKEIGKTWIKNQQLLLLLDGLDEVLAERRDVCVEAINKFCREYGETEIVVCSRIKDYEALSNRFRFQAAVFIQPLTLEQIHQYLQNAGSELSAVQTALQGDTTIQELAKSPLLLSIMTLAYQGMSMTDLPGMSLEERRQHLFDKYIQRMIERRMSRRLYSNEQVLSWLSWLAQRLKTQSQTVFLIERMQPSWFQNPWQKRLYVINILFVFLLLGLPIGLLLIPINRVFLALSFTIIFFGLIFGFDRIHPVETLKWSGKNASNSLIVGMIWGLLFGVLLKLSAATLYGAIDIQNFVNYVVNLPISGWIRGIVFGLCLGFIYVLIRGLTGPSIQTLSFPNQGIRQSAKNAIVFGLIGFLLLGLAAMILRWRILVWGIFGLLFGVAAGGGEACVKHLIFRTILYFHGCIPWNYARFLDYATERIFLQKVGGGYIFIHRLLLEHFADKKL
ncbi:hypothetical protein NUACC26_051170 [Scytonema sp. NUACC26]